MADPPRTPDPTSPAPEPPASGDRARAASRATPTASTARERLALFFAQLRRWFRPPRRLKLTREGKYFIGITFGVGFAAINTGNNLLYLLLGMLLSLIVVSGVLSELSLRELTVVRRLPPRAQVARPAPGRDRGLQPQAPHPLVRHRGRGSARRATRRQALLLPEDQPAFGAGRGLPPHAGAARSRSPRRLSRRHALSVRPVRKVARADARMAI